MDDINPPHTLPSTPDTRIEVMAEKGIYNYVRIFNPDDVSNGAINYWLMGEAKGAHITGWRPYPTFED